MLLGGKNGKKRKKEMKCNLSERLAFKAQLRVLMIPYRGRDWTVNNEIFPSIYHI